MSRVITAKQDILTPRELPLILLISIYPPPPSGWRQSLLLNVALLTSKQEPQSENAFRERAAYFITALL